MLCVADTDVARLVCAFEVLYLMSSVHEQCVRVMCCKVSVALVYFYNNRGDKETRSRLECCPIADRQTSVDSLHAVHFSACKGMAVRTTDAPRLMENQLIPFPCFFYFTVHVLVTES